jgi:hypothetical protein
VAAALGLSLVAAERKERPTQPFMRQKLVYSQGILEGLTLERYDLVVSNATLLRDMNLTNYFLALRNAEYLQNIRNFQSKVDRLVQFAKAKSLESSAEAYSQVVNSCIACHEGFRLDQGRLSSPNY